MAWGPGGWLLQHAPSFYSKKPKMIRFKEDPLDELRHRIALLEAEVALLKKGNAVTHVTKSRGNGNALSAAEKMRRYRARKKNAVS